ncbi:HepT-like ribonuclease domain-containing protein [Leptothrix sp. BB-4]
MPDRRPALLFDALQAIRAARQFTQDMALDGYLRDLLVRSAVERQLEILGEACTRLQREDAELVATIPGARLAIGLRNRIIHGYDTVDDVTVFDTVRHDLPDLESRLAEVLAKLDASSI